MKKRMISMLITVAMVFTTFAGISVVKVNAASTADNIISVAKNDVGVSGRPNKYTYWLGAIGGTYSYAWCHAFVSWCAEQSGNGDIIPRTASCATGVNWFKNRRQWHSRSGYTPKSGDIIYFDYGSNGTYDHVGIVTSCSNGRVYTIEGNASNAVKVNGGYSNGYSLSNTDILGYGSPAYNNDTTPVDIGNNFSARIRNIAMGKVVTYSGGNAVIGSSMNHKLARQIWNFTRNSNGSYKIKSCLNDMCMELHNFEDFDGGNVTCIPDNGSTAQNWFIYQNSDGSYYLKPECSISRVLDVTGEDSSDGTNIQLWTYNDTNAQRFAFDKCGQVINIGEDFAASIEHTEYWKPITQEENDNVVLRASNQKNMSRVLWHFERDKDNGWYTITSYENGKRLEVANGEDSDGANVQCGEAKDTYAQYWYVLKGWDENGQEYQYIKSACSSKNLDLYYNSENDGTNIQMWTVNGTSAQKFSIYGIGGDTTYDISSDNNKIKLGKSSNITISNTTFVISYKLHIVDPNGEERVIDNKCNNEYSFTPDLVGTYKIFCEVSSPTSKYIGSIDDRCIEVNVSDDLKNLFEISLSSSNYTYDGKAKTPAITVKNDTATLLKDTDYTVKYTNNINAGTATVTVTGIGNYTGTLTKNFTINKASQILSAEIASNKLNVGATSKITANGQGTISYTSNNTKVATVNSSGVVTGISTGTAEIKVTASGNSNYKPASKTFTIMINKDYTLGDVDRDGEITITDATLIQKHIANMISFTEEQQKTADVTNDGKINIDDVTFIQKQLAGLI